MQNDHLLNASMSRSLEKKQLIEEWFGNIKKNDRKQVKGFDRSEWLPSFY